MIAKFEPGRNRYCGGNDINKKNVSMFIIYSFALAGAALVIRHENYQCMPFPHTSSHLRFGTLFKNLLFACCFLMVGIVAE